jgi:hypothetical protein
MGPAYEIGNQYLINKNTGEQLYSGARQNEPARPYSVKSNTYIGQAPVYNPIGDVKSFFGKKTKPENKPKKKVMSGKKSVNIKININRRR